MTLSELSKVTLSVQFSCNHHTTLENFQLKLHCIIILLLHVVARRKLLSCTTWLCGLNMKSSSGPVTGYMLKVERYPYRVLVKLVQASLPLAVAILHPTWRT